MTYRRRRRIPKEKFPITSYLKGEVVKLPDQPTNPKGTENVKNRPQQPTKN